jgi:uncharacterized membrane protein YfcA
MADRPSLIHRIEVALAWILLIGSLIGWPLSLIWWAKHEPPFVLSLSWLALVFTAWDIVKTSRVHKDAETG